MEVLKRNGRVLRRRWLLCAAGFLLGLCAAAPALGSSAAPNPAAAASGKRIYIAPDDHTDYFWTLDDEGYRVAFLEMLDYYLDQIDVTAGKPLPYQARWNCDGSLWLWTYEKNRSTSQFDRLIGRVRDGHISAPMTALASCYGGQPAEAVLRGMYYAGSLERRFNLRFPMAVAIEDQTLPYGLGALWAGAGAKYSWRGICDCATASKNARDREHEIYWWQGPDGSRILMKWNSLLTNNKSIGGYAEAYDPFGIVDFLDANREFVRRYPYRIIGAFGKGWDDAKTLTDEFIRAAQAKTTAERQVIVSNEQDFFEDFAAAYGTSLPVVAASFGNEWDLYSASMAEVSARVRRAVEKLRNAEALATLVSLHEPQFMKSAPAERDQAWMNLGLYWEHDWTADSRTVSRDTRAAWHRHLADQIEGYVHALHSDAVGALSRLIQGRQGTRRFFVFNALSWPRTDVADLPWSDPQPVHVVEVGTGEVVPCQIVSLDGRRMLRVLARDVPPVGYQVFEIRPGEGRRFSDAAEVSGGVLENKLYRIEVAGRGAITSLIDRLHGDRELARTIKGRVINDLGPGEGALEVENAGPVSVTLRATASGPLQHTTRITLIRDKDRIEIRNDITQNFADVQTWSFAFNVDTPELWHEEVGAVARAKLLSEGGHYSPRNARYDWLTLNHFACLCDERGGGGVILSNADCAFMKFGNSTVHNLDARTAQLSVLAGGQVDGPRLGIPHQGGDKHFTQRFALQDCARFRAVEAMRFALEHQNPLVTGLVGGGAALPENSFSLVKVSHPDVLLWALKPAEEGIANGIIARVWNLSPQPQRFSLSLATGIAAARQATHIETDISPASVVDGSLSASARPAQLLTFRLAPRTEVRHVPATASVETQNLASLPGVATNEAPSWFPKAPRLPAPPGEILRVATVDELLAAVDRVGPGGTILLADGHYQVPRVIVLQEKRDLTIRSAAGDPAQVVLRGKGWDSQAKGDDILHIGHCEGITIADLTFTDCRSYGIKVEAENAPKDVHIYNCRFRDIGVRAIKGSAGQDPNVRAVRGSVRYCRFENTKVPPADWLYGGDYIAAIDMMALEDWTFSDNIFQNIKGRNGGGRAAIFIWVRSRGVVVERNLIVNCDRGVAFGNPGQSTANTAGEQLVYVRDGIIRNNFIAGGPDGGMELWYADRIKVYNNSIWRPERNWSRGIRIGTGTSHADVANNLVHGEIRLEGGEAQLRQNLTGRLDGYFVDPVSGNLAITPAAAKALDQGISLPEVTDDIRGRPRVGLPDLGAWESGGEVKKFGVYEVVLDGDGAVDNPFDTPATVSFTPPSGQAGMKTVHAFYDGDNIWRARVYVGEPGVWKWVSSCRTDQGLDGQSGTFHAQDSPLRGRLLTHPKNPRQWMTQDGRWFLNLNDTAYFLLCTHDAGGNPVSFEDFTAYVRDAVAHGITSFRSFAVCGPRGFRANEAEMWAEDIFADAGFTRLRLERFQETDRRLQWLQDNYPDVYVQLILFPRGSPWKVDEAFWKALSEPQKERTMHWMIARYAAYPQIFWLIVNDAHYGPEYPNNNAFAREVGTYFRKHDPWQHPLSTGHARQVPFYFGAEDWATYLHLEDSYDLGATAYARYHQSAKPVFLGEDRYEQDHFNLDPQDMRYFQRRLFWTWLLSGGSANYGGRWWVVHPYTQTGQREAVARWKDATRFTAPLHGLDSVPYLQRYFQERHIELPDFEPYHGLASDPDGMGGIRAPKLMRRGTDEYLVYHPNAAADGRAARVDADQTPRLQLDLRDATGMFHVEWYRPEDGVARDGGTVEGGGRRELLSPWQGADVVLRLTKTNEEGKGIE